MPAGGGGGLRLSRSLAALVRTARQLAPVVLGPRPHDGAATPTALQNAVETLRAAVDAVSAGNIDAALPTPADFGVAPAYAQLPPPCLFTAVYEDAQLSVTMFSLADGCHMPMHDHPTMYGFLKVLQGSVEVSAYTIDERVSARLAADHPPHLQPLSASHSPDDCPTTPNIKAAHFVGSQVLTADSACSWLTPVRRNVHAVRCLRGPCTFLDLLLPGYSPPAIDCHYYRPVAPLRTGAPRPSWQDVGQPVETQAVVDGSDDGSGDSGSGKEESSLAWLMQIPEPDTYWCRRYPYWCQSEGEMIDA